jgi:hypothetical protein
LLKLKKLTSALLKNLEQNKLLLNFENFTSHCLKNPEILLVLLIGPLLIRPYCVYFSCSNYCRHFRQNQPELIFFIHSNLKNCPKSSISAVQTIGDFSDKINHNIFTIFFIICKYDKNSNCWMNISSKRNFEKVFFGWTFRFCEIVSGK